MIHTQFVQGGMSLACHIQGRAVTRDVVIEYVEWSAESYLWKVIARGSKKQLDAFTADMEKLDTRQGQG